MPYINGNKVMGISNIIISPSDPSGPTGPAEIPDYYKISNLNDFGETEVVLDFPSRTTFKDFFKEAVRNTTVEHLFLNASQDGIITSIENCFGAQTSSNADYKLKTITLNCNLSNCTNFNNMCNYMNALQVIDGTPIDFSSAASKQTPFVGCLELKEVRVKPQTMKTSFSFAGAQKLSNETVLSIIDGLVDLKWQASQTIEFGYFTSCDITEAQKTAMTTKNWTVVLND